MDGDGFGDNPATGPAAPRDPPDHARAEPSSLELAEHLRLALLAGGLGTFHWDLATNATGWDDKLEALFGLEPGAFDGTFERWVAGIHPDDREEVLATLDRAVETKGAYVVEHRVVWPDGSTHWLQGNGQVTVGPDGEVTGAIGCTRDVTPQVLAELQRRDLMAQALESAEQERIHRERLEFLGSINDAITAARNRHEVMVNVAQAAVPRLGDWCSLYVLPHPDAEIPDIEIAHADPGMVAYAQELLQRFPYDPDAPAGMPHVIRTGEPEFFPMIDDALIAELDAPEDAVEVVRSLVLRSSIAVPLVKRGRVLGGLQFVNTNTSRLYTDADLALAEAVAARIASSLENLRLADEQRAIASTLQASLLPQELPEIPGVEVAVRYWANGEGVDVGGDFYDMFTLGTDRWAVVIGDVCGTGPTAAAVTGLARHTIASAAWHGDDHVTVLTNLNEVMRRRHSSSFCTALYGTLERTAAGFTFTFASGGHPLPILVQRDGRSTVVGAPGTLLGLLTHIQTSITTTTLEGGDAIVLYTDGATDVAPPHGLTAEQLADLVGAAATGSGSAEQVADRLHRDLSAILPIEERHDDIALLVLRVRAAPD